MDDDFDLPDVDYDVPVEEIHGGNGAAALERADRHLRYIAAIDRRAAVDAQLAATARARADRYATERAAYWKAKRDWHERPCLDLLAAIRATDPRTKTLTLPSGRITSRAGGAARVVVDDANVLYQWAQLHRPSLIRMATKVLVSDLVDVTAIVIVADDAKVLDPATGEVVPGVRVVVPETTYAVDVSSEDI